MVAARANMTTIVRMLHDPSSQMMDMLLAALRDGKLCVIDVSQMRGTPALVLSGLILRRIFDTNQQEFTKAQPQTIPVIAVVEEAQSVQRRRQELPYPDSGALVRRAVRGAGPAIQQAGSQDGGGGAAAAVRDRSRVCARSSVGGVDRRQGRVAARSTACAPGRRS
jgi:hypothetical protein